MSVAVYSAIFGQYDHPKPLPEDLRCPAFMVVDVKDDETAEAAERLGWRVIRTSHLSHMTPMMRHKYLKLHPWVLLSNFDATIWMDGSMTIVVNNFVDLCLSALGDDEWSMVRHPVRNCIYDEANFSATLAWKYDAAGVMQQVETYRSFGMPKNWGLIATGMNVRRNTPAVRKWCKHWWYENVVRTHQDQLSLPVMLWLAKDELKWNMNVPWFQWWHLSEHGWNT